MKKENRLDALRSKMIERKIEALLVSSPTNRRYFSGFQAEDTMINESSGVLFITLKKQFLLTDSRYVLAAEKEAPDFEVVNYAKGLAKTLKSLRVVKKGIPIYFEAEFMSVALLTKLQEYLPHWEALPFDLDEPRAVKSPAEIKTVAKALAITEEALESMWERLEPGISEREAAHFLESEFRRLGAEGPSFETIVASGPNGALPHATPGTRKIKEGDLIIVDCGARYNGYCADISRTKFIGSKPQKWQREIYQIVREAQLRAIEALAPGVRASDVDDIARGFIEKAGYGQYFGHGLGHGVGLDIHEAPSLSPRNKEPLKAGEIVTVEPGIYLPRKGGVRLEELVLITAQGSRLLNKNKYFYNSDFSGFVERAKLP